jgi:hypothetical protein
MADFEPAWEDLAERLPGYSIDDNGAVSESYRGIVRKFYPDLNLWRAIDGLQALPAFPGSLEDSRKIKGLVRGFYKERFWDRLRAKEIPDQKMAEVLFDTAVSVGLRRAIRLLQRSLNLLVDDIEQGEELLVTGSLDEETWGRLQRHLGQENTFNPGLSLFNIFQLQKTVFEYEVARLQHLLPVGMQRGRVFISYSRTDIDSAERLAKLLRKEGWEVWWDNRMRVGVDLERRIERELDAAHCVVVLWSASSNRSKWVRKEARVARDSRKMLPILIEDMLPPTGFKRILGVKLLSWDGEEFEQAMRELLEQMNDLATIPRGVDLTVERKA